MPEENKTSFLNELQSLDESMKRRVTVVVTAVLMVGVVYVWLGYFNGLVAGTAAQSANAAAENAQPQTAQISQPNPIVSFFGGLFSHPGQYDIQPSK